MNHFIYRLYEADSDVLDDIDCIIEDNPISENIRLLTTGFCDDIAIYRSTNILLYNGFYYITTKDEIEKILDLVKSTLDYNLGYKGYNEYLAELTLVFEKRWE